MAKIRDNVQQMQELQADVVNARQQGPLLISNLMDKEINIFARNLQETKYVMDNPLISLHSEIKTPSFIKDELLQTRTFNIVKKDIELNARTDILLHCMKLMKKQRKD